MIFEYVLEAEKSFIGAWFFEDLTICDELIAHFEQDPNKVEGSVHRSSDTFSTIDKSEKDSTDIVLMLDTDIDIKSFEQMNLSINSDGMYVNWLTPKLIHKGKLLNICNDEYCNELRKLNNHT